MRLDSILSDHQSNRNSKVDDIGFIIPDQPVKQFGKTFDSLEDCLAYADEHDIPYEVETGPFGMDAYEFPIAKN